MSSFDLLRAAHVEVSEQQALIPLAMERTVCSKDADGVG
jgi:hypothetical protein